jgi:hypothetical protein
VLLFLKYFRRKKLAKHLAFLTLKTAYIFMLKTETYFLKKLETKCRVWLKVLLFNHQKDHNFGFQEKRQFFAAHWLKSPKMMIITLTPALKRVKPME